MATGRARTNDQRDPATAPVVPGPTPPVNSILSQVFIYKKKGISVIISPSESLRIPPGMHLLLGKFIFASLFARWRRRVTISSKP